MMEKEKGKIEDKEEKVNMIEREKNNLRIEDSDRSLHLDLFHSSQL